MISMDNVRWTEVALAIPLVGAACVSRQSDSLTARKWSLVATGLTLIATIFAWSDSPEGMGAAQPAFSDSWFQLDVLSSALFPTVALMHFATMLVTLRTKTQRFSFSTSLISESLTLGTLAATSRWLLAGLLAASALPVYFELRSRRESTRLYAWHMASFAALLLLGVFLTDSNSSSSGSVAGWRLAPLVVAIMIRTGVAPFHLWFVDLYQRAAFGSSLLFTSSLVGCFAASRLLLPIASTGVLRSLGVLSLVTAVYAAGLSLVQREARSFVACVVLSNSALVLMGLEIATPVGMTGALCVWLSTCVACTGFGLTVRSLEARHGRVRLDGLLGLYNQTPALALCYMLTGLATVGFPGTFGFVGMELLIDGAVETYLYLGLAAVLAGTLSGVAMLRSYFALFAGRPYESTIPLQIGTRERLAVLLLAGAILICGLFPHPVVASRHHAAERILERRHPSLKTPPPDPHAEWGLSTDEAAHVNGHGHGDGREPGDSSSNPPAPTPPFEKPAATNPSPSPAPKQ